MSTPSLRERLEQVVNAAEEHAAVFGYPMQAPPPQFAILGSIKPLRKLGGSKALEIARTTGAQMPEGWVDVWMHNKIADRKAAEQLHEPSRSQLALSSFDSARLDHPAAWEHAKLDPPKPGEEADYPEDDARAVAIAALTHEGLPPELEGKHLLFCRYSFGATLSQPVWLALFEAGGAHHLMVINADTDRLLQPLPL